MPFIQTYSGRIVDFEDPGYAFIEIFDIAHALSRINRFCGHTKRPISVAEHSLGVYWLVKKRTGDAELAFAALLHDAHEAYVGDMTSPLKQLCPAFKEFESEFQVKIGLKFDVDPGLFLSSVVHQADLDALVTEKALYTLGETDPWEIDGVYDHGYSRLLVTNNLKSPDDWCSLFLATFNAAQEDYEALKAREAQEAYEAGDEI